MKKRKGWMNLAGVDKFFLLGAGFSRVAGMPLGNELLPAVYKTARRTRFGDGTRQSEILLDALRLFYPGERFNVRDMDKGVIPAIDFEQFLSFVCAVSACEDGTSNQLDEHGNQHLSLMKGWLADVIYTAQCQAIQKIPACMTEFVNQLTGSSAIFSFNWDTILEHLLRLVAKEFVFDGRHNFKKDTLSLWKLHGSIDWFTVQPWHQTRGITFSAISDALPGMVRPDLPFNQLNRCYKGFMTPWIVCPSYDKMYQLRQFGSHWDMLYLLFQNGGVLNIIGYSMRPDDFHTRAIIYPQLVNASRSYGLKVRVIDYARSKKERSAIRARFAEVKNCEFWFDGFNSGANDFIFR